MLGIFRQMSNYQQEIDAAQERLNSLIMMLHSLDMTVNELSGLNVDVSDIVEHRKGLDKEIILAAKDYLDKRIDKEKELLKLRESLNDIEFHEHLESPLNLSACDLKLRPFAAESLRLDSQYFSFGGNIQDDTIANVEKFIRSNTGSLGSKSGEITREVSSQINRQIKNHSVAGTLIITASTTHKYVGMLDPLVVDPDKALTAWNILNEANKINPAHLPESNTAGEADNQGALQIISGACYGSSFIGMVHILNSSMQSSGDFEKVQSGLKDKLTIGAWLENASGGFGVNRDLLEEVMVFLSTQSVNCHVSIVSMGAVPSIKSQELSFNLPRLAETDKENIQAITRTYASVASDASEANKNALHVHVQNARIQQLTQTLGKIEQEKSKVLDIGTLIEAFDNYISIIGRSDGKTPVGVPVGFYIHNLTRREIVEAWLNKYYPNTHDNENL
jgi:hypothetical protein